jgi:hypothetical protein
MLLALYTTTTTTTTTTARHNTLIGEKRRNLNEKKTEFSTSRERENRYRNGFYS